MEFTSLSDFVLKVSEISLPAASVFLISKIINRIYCFKLRTTPIRTIKKFYPDGKLKELDEEFRK